MTPAWDVRSVTTGGRAAVDVLAEAFAEDPWLTWTLPDPSAVRSLMSLFLRVVAAPHADVLVAVDVSSPSASPAGVAILLPPDVEVEDDPELGRLVIQLHGRHVGRALDADAVLAAHRPAAGSWVLHTLGVRPGRQRTGAGDALLAACLDRAGRAPLAVETSSRAARSFYERRGFAVTDRVDLADGHGFGPEAPTVWMLAHTP